MGHYTICLTLVSSVVKIFPVCLTTCCLNWIIAYHGLGKYLILIGWEVWINVWYGHLWNSSSSSETACLLKVGQNIDIAIYHRPSPRTTSIVPASFLGYSQWRLSFVICSWNCLIDLETVVWLFVSFNMLWNLTYCLLSIHNVNCFQSWG